MAPRLRRRVRFHLNKARYLVEARRTFSLNGSLRVRSRIRGLGPPETARQWLAENVLGLGYKEASHFLRNVGAATDLAILDRHLLRELVAFGFIEAVPASLSPARYLELEEDFRSLAEEVAIPLAELDILLWARATGEVFK